VLVADDARPVWITWWWFSVVVLDGGCADSGVQTETGRAWSGSSLAPVGGDVNISKVRALLVSSVAACALLATGSSAAFAGWSQTGTLKMEGTNVQISVGGGAPYVCPTFKFQGTATNGGGGAQAAFGGPVGNLCGGYWFVMFPNIAITGTTLHFLGTQSNYQLMNLGFWSQDSWFAMPFTNGNATTPSRVIFTNQRIGLGNGGVVNMTGTLNVTVNGSLVTLS
jgi:hypothetical protein